MQNNEILIIQNIGKDGNNEYVERRVPMQKGAIITADGNGVPKMVAPGPSGYVLVSSDDGEEGVKWAINESIIHVSVLADAETIFINGNGRVTLTAVVHRGSEDITNKIAANLFSWVRKSSNADSDAIWNMQHKSVGKEVIITPEDITRSALFSAEVLIDQSIYQTNK